MGELLPTCGAIFKGDRVREDLDEAYPLRVDVEPGNGSRFRPRVRKRLTADRWRAAFDEEGRLVRIDSVLRHVQKGGVEPNIRPEVWEFLLGVFDTSSTLAERRRTRLQRREAYAQLLEECRKIDSAIGCGEVVEFPRIREDGTSIERPSVHTKEPQEMNETGEKEGTAESALDQELAAPAGSFTVADVVQESTQEAGNRHEGDVDGGNSEETNGAAMENAEREQDGIHQSLQDSGLSTLELSERARKWRWTLHQIGVDVLRTDRTLEFYEKKSNRARLMDLLAVYSWLDDDVGYCQGMSDLMSPMVVLFSNDGDAFWCFERLMRRVRVNFKGDKTSIGVQQQLDALRNILESVDPPVMKHLTDIGAGSLFFAVRTLMVLFRRELSFADSLYMWEMMWAADYDASEAALEAHWEPSREPEGLVRPLEAGEGKANFGGRTRSSRGLGAYRRDTIEHLNSGGVASPPEERVATYCVAALVEKRRESILTKAQALDQVMKDFNDAMIHLELKDVCRLAVRLHKKHLKKLQQAARTPSEPGLES